MKAAAGPFALAGDQGMDDVKGEAQEAHEAFEAHPGRAAKRVAKPGDHVRTAGAQRLRWGTTGRTGSKWIRWTVPMKETFLDHLAATCNIRQSALAIGVDPSGAYYLRRADPAFAEAWGEALCLGYEMLETQLVGHALSGGGREIVNGATELTGPIDVDLALRLLAAHRVDRAPRRYGAQRKVAASDDTDAAILRKLDQLSRRAEKQEAGE